MNALLSEISRTLDELRKGLNGQLNMSGPMEDLCEALSINEVPGRNPFHRASWEKSAWPSMKSLVSWFADTQQRVARLREWVEATLLLPPSVWISGLFNPTAFLTAVKQVTARKNKLPLDGMGIETHVAVTFGGEVCVGELLIFLGGGFI